MEWIGTYGIHDWRTCRSSFRKLAWETFEPTTTEFHSEALTDWAIRPWVQLALRANFVELSNFISLFSVSVLFRSLPSSVTSYHWKIFRSSYRKLAWVEFEPTTTELCSDTLTDWAIGPWVQLTFRANFIQLLQFHLFVQCSRSILVFAFVRRHICFKRTLEEAITL